MVHVLIAPGQSPAGQPMRSIEYDTMSDRYPRFLMEEVLPEVERTYKLRFDSYSRAIAGESSGGIYAFNAAWVMQDHFSRVHSAVGSFTSIQWRPQDKLDGGNVYPFKVRKEPKRNIRIWMSDGSDDLENNFGSWPMQNIQMANSLKFREYDFHFRFGTAAHGGAQAALDLPESLAWLWRDYVRRRPRKSTRWIRPKRRSPSFGPPLWSASCRISDAGDMPRPDALQSDKAVRNDGEVLNPVRGCANDQDGNSA